MGQHNVKTQPVTPVSTRPDSASKTDTKRRPVSSPRAGQNDHDANHYCGTDAREDINHSAKTCCGNCVGCGGK